MEETMPATKTKKLEPEEGPTRDESRPAESSAAAEEARPAVQEAETPA